MLKIQTCPCSAIYVNAGIVMVSVSKYINFLNNLRDSIWFDICSVRDTSERQFLDFFFNFPDPPTLPTFKLGQGFALFIIEGVSVRHARALC